MHTHLFANGRQQFHLVIFRQRIRRQRHAQWKFHRRQIENHPAAFVRAQGDAVSLQRIGARLHRQQSRTVRDRKIGHLDQAAILLAEGGARGVDNGQVIQLQAKGVPFQPGIGQVLISRLVIGEHQNVGLLLAELGGQRDGGVNLRTGRMGAPARQ